MRKTLWVLLLSFGIAATSHTQTAKPSDLQTVGGFLDVCALKESQVSKKSLDAVQKAPSAEFFNALDKAVADKIADESLCLGYLNGLREGWQEGHEHGVTAAFFPAGVPRDLSAGAKTLSDKELNAANAAMKNDVPCLAENMTFGDLRDAIVKYFRAQVEKNPMMGVVLTSRLFPAALRDTYPCPKKSSNLKEKRQPKTEKTYARM